MAQSVLSTVLASISKAFQPHFSSGVPCNSSRPTSLPQLPCSWLVPPHSPKPRPPEPDYTLSYNVGATTDYRYRGISQSGKKPRCKAASTTRTRVVSMLVPGAPRSPPDQGQRSRPDQGPGRNRHLWRLLEGEIMKGLATTSVPCSTGMWAMTCPS